MAKIFWLVLTFACLFWYIVVTFYVAVKGVGDIRQMLRNLSDGINDDGDQG